MSRALVQRYLVRHLSEILLRVKAIVQNLRRSISSWDQIGLLLTATSFVVTAITMYVYFPYRDILPFAILLFSVIQTWGGLIAAFVLPFALLLHRRTTRTFQESVRSEESKQVILAQVIVGLLLNLTYWTLTYFLPLQSVAASFPFGKFMEKVIPNTFEEFLRKFYPISYLFLYLFPGSAGPITLHIIRYSGAADGGETHIPKALYFLQSLCYLSWALLALTLAGVDFGSGSLERFPEIFLSFVIPSTLLNLALLRAVRRRLPSFRKRLS